MFAYQQVPFKGALSGLRQFSGTECPIKKMKNVFSFTSKALFVLKTLKFLSCLWEIFFSENHTQNMVEKLFSDTFLKKQNCVSL